MPVDNHDGIGARGARNRGAKVFEEVAVRTF